MYVEAIKWAMGLIEADATPRAIVLDSKSIPREHPNDADASLGSIVP
jgi:hypothetical protein